MYGSPRMTSQARYSGVPQNVLVRTPSSMFNYEQPHHVLVNLCRVGKGMQNLVFDATFSRMCRFLPCITQSRIKQYAHCNPRVYFLQKQKCKPNGGILWLGKIAQSDGHNRLI
jgi:hypothetical protein